MSRTDRCIIETYSTLFEGLSSSNKIALLASLSKSLETKNKVADGAFYKSFGAFASEKSAEEICMDIKASRKFRNREIRF